jgi:hypothetical protein
MLRLTIVIIDSGAVENFISLRYRDRYSISGIKKPYLTLIIGLNRESLGLGIIYKSGPLLIVIRNYFEIINFDITNLREYDVVLGIL